MLGASLALIAHVAVIFALVALYAAQAEQSGLLGSLGMVLSVIGTTLASAVVFEIAGASGANADAILGADVTGTSPCWGLGFLIGLIPFGIATVRACFPAGRACF